MISLEYEFSLSQSIEAVGISDRLSKGFTRSTHIEGSK